MKQYKYTNNIAYYICHGNKDEAILEIKSLNNLSDTEAKQMVDSYHGGEAYYTINESHSTHEYTPDVVAKKMPDNYPGNYTRHKPVESAIPVSEEKQDFIASNDAHIRKCPCCQKQIEGRLDSPKLRQGAKIGSKFAVKQGINMITGTSVATAAGTIGATVGSVVIPVVGTYLGFVAGYAVGHAAQEMALDYAYDKVEEKYAKKKYFYYCPNCNLTWDSTESNDRNIIIKNFVEYYKMNKKEFPVKPESFNFDNYKKSFYALICSTMSVGIFILMPFLHKPKPDPYGYLKPELTYGDWISSVFPIIIISLIVAIGFAIYLVNEKHECDEKMEAYHIEVQEINNFNRNLHDSLVQSCNNVIRNNSPRLGTEIKKLPV